MSKRAEVYYNEGYRDGLRACGSMEQSLKDAIAMLRWQVKQPVSAESWSQWVISAFTVIQESRCKNAGMNIAL